MAQYLVLIYGSEADYQAGGDAMWDESLRTHTEFALNNGDAIVNGNALEPVASATSIRASDDGGFVVTDGPFVETKEALGGYYLLEAADLDEAIAIAKQVPMPFGGVEVRPIMVLS